MCLRLRIQDLWFGFEVQGVGHSVRAYIEFWTCGVSKAVLDFSLSGL